MPHSFSISNFNTRLESSQKRHYDAINLQGQMPHIPRINAKLLPQSSPSTNFLRKPYPDENFATIWTLLMTEEKSTHQLQTRKRVKSTTNESSTPFFFSLHPLRKSALLARVSSLFRPETVPETTGGPVHYARHDRAKSNRDFPIGIHGN